MNSHELYPLTFKPLLKSLVWGGRKLETELGKSPASDEPVGESWELVDLPRDQSVVADGPLAGRTLESLVEQFASDLLGPVALSGGRFPLLVKYIDAAQTLSVQVHPNEETAARLGGRPKSEAWFILGTEPDAALYLGIKEGVTEEQLAQAIQDNTVESRDDLRLGGVIGLREYLPTEEPQNLPRICAQNSKLA